MEERSLTESSKEGCGSKRIYLAAAICHLFSSTFSFQCGEIYVIPSMCRLFRPLSDSNLDAVIANLNTQIIPLVVKQTLQAIQQQGSHHTTSQRKRESVNYTSI
jgi:hypothetical protein